MGWRDELTVVYAADDNYAKYLGVSMYSLLMQNSDFTKINVFILDCNIGQDNKKKLEAIVDEFKRNLIFKAMGELETELDLRMGSNPIANAAYARLYLGDLLPPTIKRVLYLDCDTIVCNSLRELWETNLGNTLVAGVEDTVDKYYREVIKLPIDQPYLNSGVLLIDLTLWREENLLKQFVAFIDLFQGAVPHHDQGVINGVVGKRRTLLPLKYNVMSNVYSFSESTIKKMYFLDDYYSSNERERALANPFIIHFTPGLYGRPWEKGSKHPEKNRYLQILAKTPWQEESLVPSTLKFEVRLVAFVYKWLPRPLFEYLYRTYARFRANL